MGFYSDKIRIKINGKYNPEYGLNKIVKYVIYENHKDDKGKKHTDSKVRFYGGYGVNYKDVGTIAKDMERVQKHYKKANRRRFYHITVTFQHWIPAGVLDRAAKRLCKEYFREYQSVYGIHESTGRPHIHICLNSVSFSSGRKFQVPFNPYNNRAFKEFNISLEKFIAETLRDMWIRL